MSRLPKLQRLTAPGEHLDPVNPSVKGSTWLIAGTDLRACSDGKQWRIKPRESSDWQNRRWLKDNQLFQVAFPTRDALLRAYMAAADITAPPKPWEDPLGPLRRVSPPGAPVIYGVADVQVLREDGKWKVLFADGTKGWAHSLPVARQQIARQYQVWQKLYADAAAEWAAATEAERRGCGSWWTSWHERYLIRTAGHNPAD